MAEVVFLLCAVASIACAALLFRSYRRRPLRLSLWTAVCFLALAVNSILLFFDLAVLVHGPDLSTLCIVVAVGGVVLLLYAMITEAS
jgi:hypothetical protein